MEMARAARGAEANADDCSFTEALPTAPEPARAIDAGVRRAGASAYTGPPPGAQAEIPF